MGEDEEGKKQQEMEETGNGSKKTSRNERDEGDWIGKKDIPTLRCANCRGWPNNPLCNLSGTLQ